MAITTYGELIGARRYYLHAPSGAALIDGATQSEPSGWRTFADCFADERRTPGKGGLGIAFAHGGHGADGGAVAFFDADYKPIGADGDTPEKREWFGAALADFRAMLSDPGAALGISRSGKGRHIIARTLESERAAFGETLSRLSRHSAAGTALDKGVKVEWWDWINGAGRARFLTGRWRGKEPADSDPLPILTHARFIANPHISALIADAQAQADARASARAAGGNPPANGAGGGRARSFAAMIQPYLAAGADEVSAALIAKGLDGKRERGGGYRFSAAAIGCHAPSGTNADSVQIHADGGGRAMAVCHSHESDNERTWGAIHRILGWLPSGQKACAKCGEPHDAKWDTCYKCKPANGGGRGAVKRRTARTPCADCGLPVADSALDAHNRICKSKGANKEANDGQEPNGKLADSARTFAGGGRDPGDGGGEPIAVQRASARRTNGRGAGGQGQAAANAAGASGDSGGGAEAAGGESEVVNIHSRTGTAVYTVEIGADVDSCDCMARTRCWHIGAAVLIADGLAIHCAGADCMAVLPADGGEEYCADCEPSGGGYLPSVAERTCSACGRADSALSAAGYCADMDDCLSAVGMRGQER